MSAGTFTNASAAESHESRKQCSLIPNKRRPPEIVVSPSRSLLSSDLKMLGDDVISVVSLYLDALDVVRLVTSSKVLNPLLWNTDTWEALCAKMWASKAYVPRAFRDEPHKSFRTFFGSVRDSKRATFHGPEELCSQHFHFRFKFASGG